MLYRLTPLYSLLLIIPSLCISTPDELSMIKNQIEKTKQQFTSTSQKRKATEKSISTITKKISQNKIELNKNINHLDKSNEQINQLNQQNMLLDIQLNKMRQLLISLLQAEYQQNKKNTQNQLLTHISDQVHQQFLKNKQQRQHAHQSKATTLAEKQKTMDIYYTLEQKKDELDAIKSRQELLKSTLDQKLITQRNKLKKLIKNKDELEKLINKDHSSPKTLSGLSQKNYQPPIQGSIEHKFGESILSSDQTYDGIIYTCVPQPVKTIEAGIVRYADYLDGYGYLVIIDHGHNDLTLYGHNKQLSVHKGDLVRPHQIVGHSSNHLYFSVRKGKKPISPTHFLKS